ncbi:hypothetical protein BH11MYX3_BH11MYX3_05950 [soil metagenome]
MRRACLLLVLIAGCGRFGFETRVDEDAAVENDASDGQVPVAPVFVQTESAENPGFTTVTTAMPMDVVAGDLILAAIDYVPGGASTLNSVTDDKGNIYTLLGPFDGMGDTRHYLAHAIAVTGGPTTVTSTVSSAPDTFYDLRLHEYARTAQTDPIGQTRSATGTDLAVDGARSGAITTTEPNQLIFGFMTFYNGGPGTGTGFTTRSTYNGDLTEDRPAPTPGSYEATATMLGGQYWTAIVAAIRGR